ncbi:hypothetical protein [Kitasatospora acidiphila]|uniref:tetratricopeptide repeat protein n=1 Tax=Kitasatospora acidiphila TaxID=2567942 RepID=UPI003C75CC68
MPQNAESAQSPQSGNSDLVWALVTVWSDWAGEKPDRRRWLDLLEAAQPSRTANSEHAQLGWAVEQLVDPFALEVQHSIAVTGYKETSLPLLPIYGQRNHDAKLREIVEIGISGQSRLAVLVGGSFTGKTRACWEAVKLLPPSWRLWQPIDPSPPEAFLAGLDKIGPKTVVWLNETQNYLLSPASEIGEKVAAKLRTLMQDAQRAPILVLGTLWTEYWDVLVSPPRPDKPDLHGQARALLTGRGISVPDLFTASDMKSLHSAAADDPRLSQAVQFAAQGQIVQYLAAGPALIERYLNAPPPAKALIEAAMDARRLGHSPALPLDFLTGAAPGYMTDQQWELAGDDWLECGLAYATEPLRGARGPLARIRPRPGDPPLAQPHYRLADYLEQDARLVRRNSAPPGSFWEGAIRHANGRLDLISLAEEARIRMRYSYAFRLFLKAANLGSQEALLRAGILLELAKDWEGAALLYGRSVDLGHPEGMLSAAHLSEELGDYQKADQISIDSARTDDPRALICILDLRISGGDYDGFDRLLHQAVAVATPNALAGLAGFLKELGDAEFAEVLYRDAIAEGFPQASGPLARLLHEQGRLVEAKSLYGQSALEGDIEALLDLARLLMEDGVRDQAEGIYEELAKVGNFWGLLFLARMRQESGYSDEADRLVSRAVKTGDIDGIMHIAKLCRKKGDLADAEYLFWRAYEAGGHFALVYLVELRMRAGDVEGAERIAWEGMPTTTSGISRLTRLLEERGDLSEAERVAIRAAEIGHTTSLVDMAMDRNADGFPEEAMHLYLLAAGAGDANAHAYLAEIYEDAGDLEQAREMYKLAADGGSMSLSYILTASAENAGDPPGFRRNLRMYGFDASGNASLPWDSSCATNDCSAVESP